MWSRWRWRDYDDDTTSTTTSAVVHSYDYDDDDYVRRIRRLRRRLQRRRLRLRLHGVTPKPLDVGAFPPPPPKSQARVCKIDKETWRQHKWQDNRKVLEIPSNMKINLILRLLLPTVGSKSWPGNFSTMRPSSVSFMGPYKPGTLKASSGFEV